MRVAELVLDFVRVLIWPTVVLALLFVFRAQVGGLLTRIRHAELPGGVAFDLAEEIREVKELSAKVQDELATPDKRGRDLIPLNEANRRLIELGLQPSPSGLDMAYYRSLATQDPAVAIAGLRIEFDVLARNLALGFNIEIGPRDTGAILLRKLFDNGAITGDQMQLATSVLSVSNAVIHGSRISLKEAEDVIDSADVLAEQYLAWLSWGFPERRND